MDWLKDVGPTAGVSIFFGGLMFQMYRIVMNGFRSTIRELTEAVQENTKAVRERRN